jgi:hypothetical protein
MPSVQASIPLAIQIVIDDVGWWCGEDGHVRQEPFRSGCPRSHVPADYAAIVELGRRLGCRPQAAMVLCEWDRTNCLRRLPSATWMGRDWDNSRWVGPWLEEAAAIISAGCEHFELTTHGVGHEYWHEDGTFTRAEWHDRKGRVRPRGEVEAHLDVYAELLDQNGLGDLSSSFVPAAFLYRFGAEEGLAATLAVRSVRYVSTPYATMFRDRETEHEWFGVEAGVLTVNRTTDLVNWNVTGPEPQGEIVGPICGMHWPNVLHEDPARNLEVVERWVRLLEPYNRRLDRLLAPNAAAGFSQCVYHALGRLNSTPDGISIDLSALARFQAPGLLETFTLKVAGSGPRLRGDGLEVVSRDRDPAGNTVLTLRRPPGLWSGRLLASE